MSTPANWDTDGYRWAQATRYGQDCAGSTNRSGNRDEPPYDAKQCWASAGRDKGWDGRKARGEHARKGYLSGVCLPGNDKEWVYCTTGGGEWRPTRKLQDLLDGDDRSRECPQHTFSIFSKFVDTQKENMCCTPNWGGDKGKCVHRDCAAQINSAYGRRGLIADESKPNYNRGLCCRAVNSTPSQRKQSWGTTACRTVGGSFVSWGAIKG